MVEGVHLLKVFGWFLSSRIDQVQPYLTLTISRASVITYFKTESASPLCSSRFAPGVKMFPSNYF